MCIRDSPITDEDSDQPLVVIDENLTRDGPLVRIIISDTSSDNSTQDRNTSTPEPLTQNSHDIITNEDIHTWHLEYDAELLDAWTRHVRDPDLNLDHDPP